MVSTSTGSSFPLQPIPKSFSYLICKEWAPWLSFSSRPMGIGHMEYPKKLQCTRLFRNQPWPCYKHCISPKAAPQAELCCSSCCSALIHRNPVPGTGYFHSHVPRTNSTEGDFPGTTSWKIWILLARDHFQDHSALVMNWIPASLGL